ncbi:hypothetical protein LCGC14_1921610 [marine sediment metagenome]|uniref:Uncharacterized protein n=1 Tax=marine sediment metagenome TaxID=412755 RepID=A0A0F9GE39_9ZZZZ
MPITDSDYKQAGQQIVDMLGERGKNMERDDLICFVYNNAIGDAAKFVYDLAPHNPLVASTLLGASKDIREKLTLRKDE